MPADVRVIDLTGDGLADRMYASDTGARVWRFDIINGSNATNLVRGGVFASLGVASGIGSSPADARRFYSTPDVSVLRVDNVSYLNITIGSGFRGHPLNTAVNDRFYSMRDPIPFRPMTATEYTAMTAAPIVDDPSATPPVLVNVTTTTGTPTIPATARGWKINLAAGEKVLVDSQTFAGASLFSTFTPEGNTVRNACSAHSGTNRLYAVLSANGRAFADRDNDGNFETEDRSAELEQQGIAPSAVILFPTPDPSCTGQACAPPPVCLVGPESCGVSFTNDPVKTFWMQKEVD
jgi:type IV pilus assembly protein PilY1